MLRFEDDRPFASGACGYLSRPSSERETVNKLFVEVLVDNAATWLGAIDTGAPYLICGPDVGQALALKPEAGIENATVEIRGLPIPGDLHRLSLTILAEEGLDVNIEATAFIVRSDPAVRWTLPDIFLGWHGCLERLRFAVDPANDTLYFGPADLDSGGLL